MKDCFPLPNLNWFAGLYRLSGKVEDNEENDDDGKQWWKELEGILEEQKQKEEEERVRMGGERKAEEDEMGMSRASKSGIDLTCLRPAESIQAALGGTTSLIPDGLTRSMEEEFANSEHWAQYDYVVNGRAVEEASSGREEGHDGWTLRDFWQLERSRAAGLSLAEVAALRLFTSPWFAAANRALRSAEDISGWATTVSLIVSGILKLSVLRDDYSDIHTNDRYLYRALKGKLAEGAEPGAAHVDPAVLACSDEAAVAVRYSGPSHVPAVLLCVEPHFASRAGFLEGIGQNPRESEWFYPPFTVLEILDVRTHGAKQIVKARPTVCSMRHYTHRIRYPWSSPSDPLTWHEYDCLENAIQNHMDQEQSSTAHHHYTDNKFASCATDLITGMPKIAALGLEAYTNQSMVLPPSEIGIQQIEDEFTQNGTPTDKQWFHYVRYEKASEADEPNWGIRDRGRTGQEGLEYFHQHPDAVVAGLTLAHVLALRLYTTPAFASINAPLRNFAKGGGDDECHGAPAQQPLRMAAPHKFPVTLAFLDDGIRRLRAVDAAKLSSSEKQRDTTRNQPEPDDNDDNDERNIRILWRGMRNIRVGDEFVHNGGVEMAPMSTSYSLDIAVRYAMKHTDASASLVIFRLVTRSFMDRGANIEFLSTFPKEKECLFPPLTFLSPTGRSQMVGNFFVIEVIARL